MAAELERLARELELEDRVKPLGQISQPEVAQLMSRASAIVVPSTWEEPSGGICLEAGLARLPVVAARSGGMPEGLLEEEHALYFPIRDHEACAAATKAGQQGIPATIRKRAVPHGHHRRGNAGARSTYHAYVLPSPALPRKGG